MIGKIIAVGQHLGRWMYVTRIENGNVYGRVWKPSVGRWTKAECWYAIEAINKKPPLCIMPLPPATELRHAQDQTNRGAV